MKITHYFFNGSIGIVRVDDQYDGIKYYSGVYGDRNLKDSIYHISQWGNTFPMVGGEALLTNGCMTKCEL